MNPTGLWVILRCQQLCLVDGHDLFNAFEFQDYRTLDDDVHPISTVQLQTFVLHWQGNLTLEVNTSKVQFVAEALFIGRFHETRSQFSVNLDSSTNYLIR